MSADFALTQIEWRNDIINALRVVAYHHREGTKISRWCGPSPMPRLEKGMVDELFTGEAIAGSNWKCEVVQHTIPKKNIECAIYWLVENSTHERRWAGSTFLSAQCDMAFASRIGIDIASAANQLPGGVRCLSTERVSPSLAPTTTMRLVLEAATRRQTIGHNLCQRILLAPAFQPTT